MDIRTHLQDHLLLFDGAMGTYYAALGGKGSCEEANLTAPETIAAIHRAYVDAGARAIKTNTFGLRPHAMGREKCFSLLDAAWDLAAPFGGRACLFGDLGPCSPEAADPAGEYIALAERFLAKGAKHFLFETLPDAAGISEAAAFIKGRDPEAFILVSFAAGPDGFTPAGRLARELLKTCAGDPNIDAVGLNCGTSPRDMAALAAALGPLDKPLSLMPNAGYPTVLGRRTWYQGAPDYFGSQLRELCARGAAILGGCCGTTPEHIASAARALREPLPKRILPAPAAEKARPEAGENPFWQALCDPGKKPVAVELDPPEAAEVEKFMAGARELQQAGAAILTIADCPIARARMDSSLLACKVRRELGMQALPHMTCRDRNLNATKALLLGLHVEGVRNVLAVTGDPIPSASRDEVKSVYNFNSRMLARYIAALGQTVLPAPFQVFGALNVNARNFSVQLDLARQKVENGMCGFLTQPVLTEAALENLRRARQTLDARILGGIIPIVSHRNAVFMDNEVSGISVGEDIIRRYEGLDRAAGEDLAVELSLEAARKMADLVDGFYLITPFGRTGLMARILGAMEREGLI